MNCAAVGVMAETIVGVLLAVELAEALMVEVAVPTSGVSAAITPAILEFAMYTFVPYAVVIT